MATNTSKKLQWGKSGKSIVSDKIGSPSRFEGNSGDVQIRESSIGAKIWAKIGGKWLSNILYGPSDNITLETTKNINLDATNNVNINGKELTMDASGDITLDADGDNIKMLAGGTGSGLDFIQSGTGDYTIKNLTSDKDIIFNVNDGGADTEVLRVLGATKALRMYQANRIELGGASEYITGNGTDIGIYADDDINIVPGGEVNFGTATAGFTAQTGTDTTSIDWGEGNKFHLLMENNSTITFATNPSKPCNLLLKVTQGNGGSKIITWAVTSGDIYWAGGGKTDTDKPTLTTTDDDSDILTFYWDGTNYFGVASLNFDTAS